MDFRYTVMLHFIRVADLTDVKLRMFEFESLVVRNQMKYCEIRNLLYSLNDFYQRL